MIAEVIYEINRRRNDDDSATPFDSLQLLSVDGELLLRDAAGNESPCERTDTAEVIPSTPALRDIRAGESVRINCAPEMAAKLPLILKPPLDGADPGECNADVKGVDWGAYLTIDEDYVMLPGYWGGEPNMSPCWAEFGIESGEWNSLIGRTRIGLATPNFAVECGRYESTGFGCAEGAAVAISQSHDFAAVFVDWLLNAEVLCRLWEGYGVVWPPSVRLFAEAASAANKRSFWNFGMGDDEWGEDEDQVDQDDDEQADEDFTSAYLKLHLTDELIEQVRERLRSLKPVYAEISRGST